MKEQRHWGRAGVGLLLGLAVMSCEVNPATGKRDFTPFMSASQERQVGQQAHPDVVKENGGVYANPKLTGYVTSVGKQLAGNSEMSDQPFTFTVLNAPIVNAFALPGGYVYVTRGILAMFNTEAELASVLGHEIGHVTARHSAKRYNQAMMTGILGAGVGVALGNSALTNLINQGSQLYLLGYSRDQEYQSDSLGIRYMTRAGYDPYGSPDMLRALLASDKLSALLARREGTERPPEFYSTHPNTEKRVAEAETLAKDTGVTRGSKPSYRDRYLDAIDGMLYGDDPEQGLIKGQMFWHPALKFTFTAPKDYLLQNSATAVVMQGTNKNAALFVPSKAQSGQSTTAVLQQQWAAVSNTVSLQNIQTMTINGMEAATGATTVNSQSGQVVARLTTIRYDANAAYSFLAITPANLDQSVAGELRTMTQSFRKLKADELDKIKPLQIKIVTVKSGETQAVLAKRMAFPDYQLERFRTINGLDANDTFKGGDRVKIVIEKP